MLYSTVLLAATAFTGFASALNYSTSGPLSIDASQIKPSLRESWCTGERNSCNSICSGRASPNTCDSTSLQYQCVCTDGSMPNISDYSQTMPFFICEQWIANCVNNHPNDLDGIAGCRSVVCGSKNATLASSGSSNSSSGTATTSAGSGSGSMTASITTTTASSVTTAAQSTTTTATTTRTGAAATMIAKEYGHAVLAVGALAAFGLAL